MIRFAIGIDIGGTTIKAGLFDESLCAVKKQTCATVASDGPAPIIGRIVEMIEFLRAGVDVLGVGVGCPGPLSPSRGVVHHPANLPGWLNVPLRDTLAKRTGLPVVIDNDGNLAAFGEHRVDPSVRNLVLLTLGTGVGSGTIIDGRIFHGHHENASEWGHVIVHPGGLPCSCGQRGCLEQYASAANVARRMDDAVRSAGASSRAPSTALDVVAAAQRGDAMAAEIWDDACQALALACVNIQHAINPQKILLGGGMSAAGDFLVEGVRRRFDLLKWRLYDDEPRTAPAALGVDAGAIGAAALVFEISHAWPETNPPT